MRRPGFIRQKSGSEFAERSVARENSIDMHMSNSNSTSMGNSIGAEKMSQMAGDDSNSFTKHCYKTKTWEFDDHHAPVNLPYRSASSSSPHELSPRVRADLPASNDASLRRSPQSHPLLHGVDYWDSSNMRHSHRTPSLRSRMRQWSSNISGGNKFDVSTTATTNNQPITASKIGPQSAANIDTDAHFWPE